ncbi:MAG TPA: hypothetical protein VNS53_05865 [Sphingomicrobium sp.]|jgi:hypothetical protein|nr:hypothetical protein [Sphingomicrobium sp.]
MTNDRRMADPVAVTVKPLGRSGGDLVCSITGGSVDGGVLELSKGRAHRLTFHLVPGKVDGIEFADGDCFCSSLTGCPDSGDTTDQFPAGCAQTPNGNTLIVEGGPGTADLVHYAIQFTDGTGTLSWDPIIVNG